MKPKNASPDSARRPLVPSFEMRELSSSDEEWREEDSPRDAVAAPGFLHKCRASFQNAWGRASHRAPVAFLRARSYLQKLAKPFARTGWKKMYVYILLLVFLILGTIVCLGVHLAHTHRSDDVIGVDQHSHGHRYSRGNCRRCLDPTEKDAPALVIIQANDIYELGPYIYPGGNSTAVKNDALATENSGGLSKFLALKRSYEKVYGKGNVMAVMAGDYLSPSALSTARIPTASITALQEKYGRQGAGAKKGEQSPPDAIGSLAGAHMISVGNKIFDIATFGNHEFDLSKGDFQQRVDESWFPWLASNLQVRGNFTRNMFKYRIKAVPTPASKDDKKGQQIRVGFISATMDDFAVPSYVRILSSAKTKEELSRLARYLRTDKSVDFIVLITHQSIPADVALIRALNEEGPDVCSGVDLVLGGHEHESSYGVVGRCAVPLTKSFYNAKAVYVHKIFADTDRGERVSNFHVESIFVPLDGNCPQDAAINEEIMDWWSLAADAFLKDDLDLKKAVAYLPERHDLRNEVIYHGRNDLMKHIADALVFCSASASVDGAAFNTGAIRLDNFIGPGLFTVYDVIRVWPFGDQIELVTLDGVTLRRVIETGNTINRGTHGFLQLSAAFSDGCMRDPKGEAEAGECLLNGEPIIDEGEYTIALPAYLLEGKQENLEFLAGLRAQPLANRARREADVRHCLTTYLPRHYPMP